ncbi:hypothetical protein Kpol_298p2 [Vanderwaltozyma polyspora DSM 70294]|uniref:DNA repair protein RAD2 n=1 Tax=Vanderwaltozyma polyspora (strain ATCC 22028 / DSM 70294 / BCRC 21397 / CBS 2163 / NBRC 10782 / NRRL Y-8283 / UCD 57-17) TaxID=436907 RepID=A7TT55_VANPO|nr:uncharacterized protein Kpol_298p2 [Vanderwaltozyma polyspora DSM 70294]EDO14550.1 hypothetical protein Kpol_298p2 [Vanderwaltozyma polyspora DSM 70294]
MGVHSLWDILGPTARPVRLESLHDQKMAVDASIWIYQFLKAVRDNKGNAVKDAHIVGFFRRICKLLFYGIKPVFVFDGGVPALKKATIQERKEKRQGKRDSAAATARKLLAIQLQKHSEGLDLDPNAIPNQDASSKNNSNKIFRPHDEWHLPDIPGFKIDEDDDRVLSAKNYDQIVNSITDEWNGIDLDSINPASKEFEELPKATQYMILTTLRLKSRLRMGYSKEQLEELFPNSMDFSKFQIDMVKRRNFFTQKLLNTTGVTDGGASKMEDEEVVNRISGQVHKEYKLARTDHGWALGFGEYDGSEIGKAIHLIDDGEVNANTIQLDSKLVSQRNKNNVNDIEERNKNKYDDEDDEDDESMEWEDVELKSDGTKKIEDFSLKAARLYQVQKPDMAAGGQAFLDKRIDADYSPVKLAGTIKRKVIENIPSESDNEDDYLRQIEEIELMEAIQKSKKDTGGKNGKMSGEIESVKSTFTSQFVTNDSSERKLSTILDQENKKLLPEVTSNFKVKEHHKQNNKEFSKSFPSENEQNLNLILSKIPGFDKAIANESILFSNAQNKTEKNIIKENRKEHDIIETPSWFGDSNQSTINPFISNKFVEDKDEVIDRGNYSQNNSSYALVSGSRAFDMIEAHTTSTSDLNSNENDVVEIVSDIGSDTENNNYEADQNKDEAELLELESQEKVWTKVDHIKTSDPNVKEQNNNKSSEKVVAIFDYDFTEDEESNIAENIRKEWYDFNKFQSEISDKTVSSTFLEDELFEQQMKDKRDSDEVTPEMVIAVQELLSRFGIPYIVAPMEAEAQCAELLLLKLVDGIITDDSDVFLFGGAKIYKNMFQEKKYVEFYDVQSINSNLALDRKNMIDLALLLGSDYTNGVKGLGPVLSMEVLADFGTLERFKEWYDEGMFDKSKQESDSKFRKDLRKKLIKNEVVLSSEFPSKLVIDSYINPEVDHDKTSFVWGTPDLDMLREFMRRQIGWPQEKSDEILIPLIKDINKRKAEKQQRTLSEFFPSELIQESRRLKMSKRIVTATGKLKQRRTK